MRSPASLVVFAAALLGVPLPVRSATAPDLSARLIVDGIAEEFTAGEGIFGTTDNGVPEEDVDDSLWGPFNDINQIHVTWDAQNLYIAGTGFIWNNNMILLLDLTGEEPDATGMSRMTELNSWRRNFTFSEDFTPDLFFATWDGNSTPQVWTSVAGQPDVVVQVPNGSFPAVATFTQNTPGRAMETAIPWTVVFGGAATPVTDPDTGASTFEVPAEMTHLRLVAVITAGPDGTGGPDSAPDNLSGHQNDSSVLVTIDNFAILPLDEDGDGIVDFGIEPRERIDFKVRPPFQSIRFEVREVVLDRKIVSPEEGRNLAFHVRLSPELDPTDDVRTIKLSARVYDSLGRLIRTLYTDDRRFAGNPSNLALDQWDGRDARGEMVPGGIYMLTVISGESPGESRESVPFGVVR